jgi:anti-anti-sigma factor
MAIEAERDGTTLIARTDARVDGANARAFQDELETIIDEDDRTVILDLQRLLYISSAGLRVILLTAKALGRQEIKFAVCSLTDPVQEVFKVSGFDKIIGVHPSLSDAKAALQG